MTAAELAAIEARLGRSLPGGLRLEDRNESKCPDHGLSYPCVCRTARLLAVDIPALVAEVRRLQEAIGPTMAIVDVADLARLVAREKVTLADVADLRGRINRARVALNPNGEEPDR